MKNVWERWVPRTEDYWGTFASPFRRLITDVVDKSTPPGGSVMDFGCGAGVQTFLIRQRRPDLTIHAVDCNQQARNLTQILMFNDPRLIVEPTPVSSEDVPTVDTILSTFTSTYLHLHELDKILTVFLKKTQTLIFTEPTSTEDVVEEYAGMPCGGYRYPYGHWLRRLGWTVEETPIDGEGALNMMRVAKRPEGGLARLS